MPAGLGTEQLPKRLSAPSSSLNYGSFYARADYGVLKVQALEFATVDNPAFRYGAGARWEDTATLTTLQGIQGGYIELGIRVRGQIAGGYPSPPDDVTRYLLGDTCVGGCDYFPQVTTSAGLHAEISDEADTVLTSYGTRINQEMTLVGSRQADGFEEWWYSRDWDQEQFYTMQYTAGFNLTEGSRLPFSMPVVSRYEEGELYMFSDGGMKATWFDQEFVIRKRYRSGVPFTVSMSLGCTGEPGPVRPACLVRARTSLECGGYMTRAAMRSQATASPRRRVPTSREAIWVPRRQAQRCPSLRLGPCSFLASVQSAA